MTILALLSSDFQKNIAKLFVLKCKSHPNPVSIRLKSKSSPVVPKTLLLSMQIVIHILKSGREKTLLPKDLYDFNNRNSEV